MSKTSSRAEFSKRTASYENGKGGGRYAYLDPIYPSLVKPHFGHNGKEVSLLVEGFFHINLESHEYSSDSLVFESVEKLMS